MNTATVPERVKQGMAFSAPLDGKVRLNLGCGHYIWKGFINVDMPGSYSKMKPDVECDVRVLPFEDNYADEIYAIHVIEHFYVWEVEAILREWLRVLKPGGKIVLEVPDLRKVIAHFVEAFKGERIPLAKTYWALYGDPTHESVPMLHKWAYIAEDLGHHMLDAGFVDVMTGPPQFHRLERDMRMVARKPAPSDDSVEKKEGI